MESVQLRAIRGSRRKVLIGTGVLPAAFAMACGGAQQTTPAASSTVIPGKVLVMSYQTSAPRLDRPISIYDDLNKEMKPKGLEVVFANPGMEVLDKVTTMHVAGTPADMWESPNLWRQAEGMVAEITPFLTRDKVDEKQWLPDAINSMKAPVPWPPPSGAKVWGMPVSISAPALSYNPELFDAAGHCPGAAVTPLYNDFKVGKLPISEFASKAQDIAARVTSF